MKRVNKEDILNWLRNWWRALLAELLATGLLVWFGCAACVKFDQTSGELPIQYRLAAGKPDPALSFGFMVMANVIIFGAASGAHMNPAVTLAALLYRKLGPLVAFAYLLSQLLGAIIGYSFLVSTSPRNEELCVTLPGPGVHPLSAMFIEVAITFVLVTVVCCVWAADDPESPNHIVPLYLGLVVAGLIYAMGRATGASLNPARSFAPALLTGAWRHHWVYWFGPLLGGALGSLLHRFVLSEITSPPVDDTSK